MRVLGPAAIAAADTALLDDIAGARELVVAAGSGDLTGTASAALLLADFAILAETATLELATAETWAAAVSRIGRKALRLQLMGTTRLSAAEAADAGLVDSLVPAERDSLEWISDWVGSRSVQALDAAAGLIRASGGDRLERAEFARLFALELPQKGLDAFLNRRGR